jgi:hypothetical protein
MHFSAVDMVNQVKGARYNQNFSEEIKLKSSMAFFRKQ